MNKTLFDQLVVNAQQDRTPQRLLFLFAKANASRLPFGTNHKSGTIAPVMCVDKLPSELTSFNQFVQEADNISKDWDFIFCASWVGENGAVPTSSEVEPQLSKMSNDLATGQDLSRYLVLNREGQVMVIS